MQTRARGMRTQVCHAGNRRNNDAADAIQAEHCSVSNLTKCQIQSEFYIVHLVGPEQNVGILEWRISKFEILSSIYQYK